MRVTYSGCSPEDVRTGDLVQDRTGLYTAHSDGILDQWGDYNVLDDKGRYRAYGPEILLTVTMEEEGAYV